MGEFMAYSIYYNSEMEREGSVDQTFKIPPTTGSVEALSLAT